MTHQYCQVLDCRHSFTHVVKGHQCGTCKKFGHGQLECGNQTLIKDLKIYDNDTLPNHLHCKRPYCIYPQLHMTSAHKCVLCNAFHSKYNCPTSPDFVKRKEKELLEYSNKVNTTNSTNTTKYKLKCPSCKTENTISPDKNTAYSLDSYCIICCTNKVNVFFTCGHVNVCWECVEKMADSIQTNNQINNCVGPDITYDNLNKLFQEKFCGIDGKIYASFYAGMGCNWLCRRNGIGELIEIHFAHSDDHYNQNTLEATNGFILGYTKSN